MSKYKQMIKARALRQMETEFEQILWEKLRNNKLGIKFRRQHPIDNFVIDFYCPKHKIAIELDGFHHYTKDGKEYDKMRTKYLESKGVFIVRFNNRELVKNTDLVLENIKNKITPSPVFWRGGEGGEVD